MIDQRRIGIEEVLDWARDSGREYPTDIDGTTQMHADYQSWLKTNERPEKYWRKEA